MAFAGGASQPWQSASLGASTFGASTASALAGSTNGVKRSAAAAEPSSLSALLESAKRLQTRHGDSTAVGPLPRVDLSLDQIERLSRASALKAQRENAGMDVDPIDGSFRAAGDDTAKAQYVLGQASVDTTKLAQTINRLDPQSAFAQLTPLHDNDVEGLVRDSHERSIIQAIEEGRRDIVRNFYRSLDRDMRKHWERQKAEVFQELGAHGSDLSGGMAGPSTPSRDLRSPRPTSTVGPSVPSSSTPFASHARMFAYDQVVGRLNEHRKNGEPFAVASAFAAANSSLPQDAKASRTAKLWRLVTFLVREKDVADGEFQGTPIAERAYAAAYLSADPESPDSVELREGLRAGALAFLEDLFLQEVNRELADNVADANLGGDPSIANKIRAFVQLRHDKQKRWAKLPLKLAGGVPVWARLFYLLRAGQSAAARSYAIENQVWLDQHQPGFTVDFATWLDSPSRRLSPARQSALANAYNALRSPLGGQEPDPFQLAVVKLVARADLRRRKLAAVTDTVEDWLWVQLSLVRDRHAQSEANVNERYTLSMLAALLTQDRFGETHFGALYFDVLMLCGEFEQAIAHLASRPQHQVDAVHFAITLAYYGLLRVTDSKHSSDVEQLAMLPDGKPAFNYARCLYRYHRQFARAGPKEALQYLCLIPLGGIGAPDRTLLADLRAQTQAYVRELVRETPDTTALLGSAHGDGSSQTGAVGQNAALIEPGRPDAYAAELVRSVAQEADKERRFGEAIRLYHLAHDDENIIRVLNGRLAAALVEPTASPDQPKPSMAEADMSVLAEHYPVELAEQVLSYFSVNGRRPPDELVRTCRRLIQLKSALVAFDTARPEDGIELVRRTELVPLDVVGGDISRVLAAADAFNHLDEALTRHFGNVLLETMKALYRLHGRYKDSPYGDASRQQMMAELKAQARSLMMFAGMLRYRLTSDIYERLSQLDVRLA